MFQMRVTAWMNYTAGLVQYRVNNGSWRMAPKLGGRETRWVIGVQKVFETPCNIDVPVCLLSSLVWRSITTEAGFSKVHRSILKASANQNISRRF